MKRLLILALAAATLLAGCSNAAPSTSKSTTAAGAAAGGPVSVSLVEWKIDLSARAVPAGSTVFNVRNDGKVPHDLWILKTDLQPDRLPTASGIVDTSTLTVVAKSEQLTPGDGKKLTADLPKGRYVLLCNVIGHYNSGQFAAFTVE